MWARLDSSALKWNRERPYLNLQLFSGGLEFHRHGAFERVAHQSDALTGPVGNSEHLAIFYRLLIHGRNLQRDNRETGSYDTVDTLPYHKT